MTAPHDDLDPTSRLHKPARKYPPLEPEAGGLADTSSAISLKRIADALERLAQSHDAAALTSRFNRIADTVPAERRDTEPAPAEEPWREWHGGECPVPGRTLVDLRFKNGTEDTFGTRPAGLWQWGHGLWGFDIIAWRPHK